MGHVLLRHVRQHRLHAFWFVVYCRTDESCVSILQFENRSDESIDRSRARNVVNEVAISDVVKSAYDCVRLEEKEWRCDVGTIENEERRGRRTQFLYPDPFAPSLTRCSTSVSLSQKKYSCCVSSMSLKETYERRDYVTLESTKNGRRNPLVLTILSTSSWFSLLRPLEKRITR